MTAKSLEIHCPGCGRVTLLLRQPNYEGFTKVGESLRCASCGHAFASEDEVPFKHATPVRVFTDDDIPPAIKVFEKGENERLCGHCLHYVINPFVQWCGHHKKEVEATDTCPAFQIKPPPKAELV
jgi:hypothetical protein